MSLLLEKEECQAGLSIKDSVAVELLFPIFRANNLASFFFRFFLEGHDFVPPALVSFDKSSVFHVSEDSAGLGF